MYTNKINLGHTVFWNPWYGCRKKTEGCQNCFIRFLNEFIYESDDGYLLAHKGDIVIVSLETDFFIEEGDNYRSNAWQIIKENSNLIFVIITKRPERIIKCLPNDWGEGYDNVVFDITIENQKRADERLPILKNIPCKHKWATCSPLLEEINLEYFLQQHFLEHVECGGETGINARVCQLNWIESLSKQCKKFQTRFSVMQLGYRFYNIYTNRYIIDLSPCYMSHSADELNLSYYEPLIFNLDNKKIIK